MKALLKSWFRKSSGGTGSGASAKAPGIPIRVSELGALSIVEVEDATVLAGDLFFGAFRAKVPTFPRHFVMIKTNGASPLVIGYVHYTQEQDAYLAGGLVVAALQFRRLDPPTAALVRERGGLAEWLMTETCAVLTDASAIFAYMGDAKSITVNTRVGFEFTGRKHLYVIWGPNVGEPDRLRIVERVAAIGPF